MPSYLHPGVYVEEIPSGSKPIEGVGTSTAAFVGYTVKGPIGEPKLITRWDEYVSTYGGVQDLGKKAEGDPMGLSVSAFFQNGGTKAYIVRITDSDVTLAKAYVDHPLDASSGLHFTAVNAGKWANELIVKLSDNLVISGSYDVVIGREEKDSNGNISFKAIETFKGVSLSSDDPLYIENAINGVSACVKVAVVQQKPETAPNQYLGTSTSGDLTGVFLDFSGSDWTSPATRRLGLTIDGEARNITVSKKNFAILDDLAADITSHVTALSTNDKRYTNFVCTALGKHLVLTSGTRNAGSSVVVDPFTGLAPTLKLGVPYIGLSASASAVDLKTILPLDLTAKSEADRTLSGTVDAENTPFTVVLDAISYEALSPIATKIAEATGVTCSVENDRRLVLASETHVAGSAVVVANSVLAATLKLGTDNGGAELTGQQYRDLDPTRVELTGQQAANAIKAKRDMLDGGADGSAPKETHYEEVFTKFVKIRDINIICLPGRHWSENSSGDPVIQKAIAHAEKMKNRMVIIDPAHGKELTTAKEVSDMGLPSQTYCVTYYPWVRVANMFYDPERKPGLPKNVLVPPSGYAAGMWAKIDGKRGVWKAAAGMETSLLGVTGLEYTVEDDEQDSLNPWGVNCLRRMPGAGHVIWGARTLATKADPEWRYVPVRRTAIMIEQSIYEGIQWAVFEPNDHRLWSSLRANIDSFMNGLFRAGAFQGEKASDAYFVRCNLGDTMTQGDIDAGQVIVIVGFAPLKPAEFVIVRIQQKVNQQ